MHGPGAFAFFRSRPFLMLLLTAALGLSFGVVFFSGRSPVVVVSDAAFETLYGEKRSLFDRGLVSLRSFRPVRLALVSEGATPVSSADAALAASGGKSAACVVFPARYRAGADALLSRFPDAKTVVVGEISVDEPTPGQTYLSIDRDTDLYRAGRIVGAIVGGRVPALRVGRARRERSADAFSRGLADSRYRGAPVVLDSEAAERSANASFLVADASGEPSGPPAAVVFSWVDPAFLLKDTAVVFDDSPSALLYRAYRAGIRKESSLSPSIVRLIGLHKMSAGKIFEVQAAARARRH